jgi:hypothetical protein
LSSIEFDLVTNLGSAQLSAIDLRIDQRHERLSKPNGAEQLSRAPDEGGNQRSSEVIRGHQMLSEGAEQLSRAPDEESTSSATIRGH